MAKNYWRGDYTPTAQRDRFTVGGAAHVGDVLTLTRNGKSATYALSATDTLATAAAGLAAAWTAATFPEAAESNVEYTDGNAFLDLVAQSAGVPFTVMATVTGAGATTTLTKTSVTTSTGPFHFDEPKNWSLGTTPTATDDVVVGGGGAMLYGLGAVTVNSWEWRASYTENVGLPRWNAQGYAEDRVRKPTITTATGYIGRGDGSGSGLILFTASAGSTWYVFKTANRVNDSLPAVDINAAGNITSVQISAGDVGLLTDDEGTARTFAAVHQTGDDTRITTGRDATVTTFDMDRGTTDALGTVTTVTVARGNYTQHEGTLTNLVAYGGLVKLNHQGTIASVIAEGRGSVPAPQIDCEGTNLPKVFTTSRFRGGAVLFDENQCTTRAGAPTDHEADSAFFAGSRLGPVINWQ